MAKKEIETRLKNGDEVLKNKTLALVTKNMIKYSEDNIFVTIKIIEDLVILIRENNEYQLCLKLKKNNKMIGSYLLKDNNLILDLEILTKDLKIDDNSIYIKYQLNDEDREYWINILEEKND